MNSSAIDDIASEQLCILSVHFAVPKGKHGTLVHYHCHSSSTDVGAQLNLAIWAVVGWNTKDIFRIKNGCQMNMDFPHPLIDVVILTYGSSVKQALDSMMLITVVSIYLSIYMAPCYLMGGHIHYRSWVHCSSALKTSVLEQEFEPRSPKLWYSTLLTGPPFIFHPRLREIFKNNVMSLKKLSKEKPN